MKSSVKGKLRNTQMPLSRPLAPLYEAIANAFHAIEDAGEGVHAVDIEIVRLPGFAETGIQRPNGFVIADSGVGFDEKNATSFFTTDSTHKATRGGKGNGRFLWLKAFDQVKVTSHFRDETQKIKRREFAFTRSEDQDVPPILEPTAAATGTRLDLEDLDEKLGKQLAHDLDWYAERIIAHFLPMFRRSDCPAVVLREEGETPIELKQRFAATVSPSAARPFKVGDSSFTLTGYRVRSPEARDNVLVFAADERAVKREKLASHIKGLDRKIDPESGGGAVYVGFIEGDALDDMVRTDRLGFDEDDEDEGPRLIEGPVSLAAIRKVALDEVRADLQDTLAQIQVSKESALHEYVTQRAPEYRKIVASERDKILNDLPSNPRPKEIEATLGRVWMEQRADLKARGVQLLNQMPDAENMEAYNAQMEGFLDRFEELDQAALAQHVTHRRVVLNLLEKALRRSDDTGKYQLESLIHRMVHPTRKTSEEVEFEEQNLWLLDDRITYHEHLASEMDLKFNPRLETDSKLRPDLLAIFDRTLAFGEGRDPYIAFSIIEFKRPDRRDDPDRSPLNQVFDVVRDIRAGHFKDRRGRLIEGMSKDAPAFCYVVCDLTPPVIRRAEDVGGQKTPDGRGYFGWNANLKLYFEVISYEKMVSDALRRNRLLFKKLGLPTDRADE